MTCPPGSWLARSRRIIPWLVLLSLSVVGVWALRPHAGQPRTQENSPAPVADEAASDQSGRPRDLAPRSTAARPDDGSLITSAADDHYGTETIPGNAGVPPARRVRVARIDPAWLDRKHSPLFDVPPGGSDIALPLWPDRPLIVHLDSSEVVGQDRHVIRGEVDGVPGARFTLAVAGDAVAFSVFLDPGERHGGVPLSDGRIAIYDLDTSGSPGCAGALPSLPDANALAEANARPFAVRRGAALANATGGSTGTIVPPTAAAVPAATAQVDVLVVYTPDVLASATPSSALTAKVDLALAEANDEYARSETRVQLRLVGLKQTTYTEPADNATTLDRLRQTSDGFMDEVHATRDQLGADLVCLLVQKSDPSNIGIAYILSTLADPNRGFNDLFAFSVVQYAWLTGSSTFSHELGHNFGCAHDRENSRNTQGVFSYSYGYRFQGADSRTYRTIMAYQPGISAPYFSNPRLTYAPAQRALGVDGGLPGEADNARSINQTAFSVADYRSNLHDPPARGRLANVSTRAFVGTGDQVLIGGFYVNAPGPKQILVRARGPSLEQFGVPGPLADPELELVNQATHQTIIVNQDWAAAPNAADITATGLGPSDAREPAMLVSLDPGGYTAITRGQNGSTGIAAVDVFEVDGNSAPKLVNLSTRGWVDTGDRVMIGGMIVKGNPGETKRLLLRALGPSLADANVSTPVDDPALSLYNEAGEELINNDDWDYLSDTQQAQVKALNLAPTVRRESVLLIDLPPGAYTLIVRPFENDGGAKPGVGLVEAYEVTTP